MLGRIVGSVFVIILRTFGIAPMPHPYQMRRKRRPKTSPDSKTKAETAPTLADAIDTETAKALQMLQTETPKKTPAAPPPTKAPSKPPCKAKAHKKKSSPVPMHKRKLDLPKSPPRILTTEEQDLLDAVLMDVDRGGFSPPSLPIIPTPPSRVSSPTMDSKKPMGTPPLDPVPPSPSKLPKLRPIRKKPVTLAEGGIDARQLDRFRKGQMEIEATLDLHGMSQRGAEANLISFFGEMRERQKRCLLIISGKGQGILRQYVWQWLHESPYGEHILAVSTAKPYHGGDGAFYVLLRRRGA